MQCRSIDNRPMPIAKRLHATHAQLRAGLIVEVTHHQGDLLCCRRSLQRGRGLIGLIPGSTAHCQILLVTTSGPRRFPGQGWPPGPKYTGETVMSPQWRVWIVEPP
jgi:hypothetical protein